MGSWIPIYVIESVCHLNGKLFFHWATTVEGKVTLRHVICKSLF